MKTREACALLLLAIALDPCNAAQSALSQDRQEKPRSAKEAQKRLEGLACNDQDPGYSHHTDEGPQVLPTPPANKGLVYVVRSSGVGPWEQTKLAVDQKWVGTNGTHNYFYVELEPGVHYFCSDGEGRSLLSLIIEEGKTYYLQQSITPYLNQLQLLDEEAGKSALAKCKKSLFIAKNKTHLGRTVCCK